MILSILIATVEGREKSFNKLMDSLTKQYNKGDIEIIIDKDNKEVSIGAKRQRLLEKAQGEYIVFIDDDDEVSSDYIGEILKAIESKPDTVGFLIDCTFDGKDHCIAKASSIYKEWAENIDGFRYVRSSYHKTAIKREIALKVGFQDKRFGEDHEYSMGVMKYIISESFINKVLYYYRYSSWEPHNLKYGIK